MSGLRLHPSTSVAQMAEQLLHGITTLRREEAIALTPAAVAPRPATEADASRAGLAAAASMVQITLEEIDGSIIERGIATAIARRVIRAYLDQLERIGGRR
jgi:hypothetical protein